MVARYTQPGRTFQKANTHKMCVDSILSWPYPDLAGDIVDLDGIDFTPHQSHCEIDLEHARTHLKAYPVAWARESLSKPGAPYAVERVFMNLAGAGEPDEWHTVPIGTSYFDPKDRISSQTFALVEQGLLPAVSLEFRMIQGFFKARGWSDLENRPSYDFGKVNADKWTLCARPVNGGAMHLEDDTILKAHPVPVGLATILRDRRVSVGGQWEPLHGRLLKALADVVQPSSTTTAHIRWGKAMEPDEDDDFGAMGGDGFPDESGTDADLMPDMEEGMGAPPANGVSAIYAHVQALEDAADALENDLNNSDNPKLITEVRATLADLRKHSAKLKKLGDKHDAKLQAVKGGAAEPDDADDADSEGDDTPDMGRDEEGILKAVRPVYRPALLSIKKAQPRRLKASEVHKAKADAGRKVRSVFDEFRATIQ